MLISMLAENAPQQNPDIQYKAYMTGIAAGDKEALHSLYQETRSAVYGFALSILKNTHDAEEVLQDTYIQVFRAAQSYQPSGKLMSWLLTITRNLALMKIRQQARFSGEEPPDIPDEHPETPDDRMLLQKALDTLAEGERQIVILHAVTGFKQREIAELLDMPLSTVLSKYSRALKKLRLALGDGSLAEEVSGGRSVVF